MSAPAKKFARVIWGGYARGNTGDELCLAAALGRAQRDFGGDVAILSERPEFTAQLFPQAAVIPCRLPERKKTGRRENFFGRQGGWENETAFDPACEWMRVLSSADGLYLAGGGYLTDLFPLELTLPPIQLAVKLKIPIATAPLGLGPFHAKVSADAVAAALRGANLKVRDEVSLAFCRQHGLAATLEPDDAFALVKTIPAPVSGPRPGDRPRKIGVCIFPQYGREKNSDLSEWWIACLRGLRAQHPGFEIEGFCFHTSPEAEFGEMKKLFPRAGLSPDKVSAPTADFRHAVNLVRGCDFIVATRFHAVVAANAFCIPNFAVASGEYYRAKMRAAVSGHENFSRLIDPHNLSPEDFLAGCKLKMAGNA